MKTVKLAPIMAKRITTIGMVVGILIEIIVSVLIPGSNVILELLMALALAIAGGLSIRNKLETVLVPA